MTYFGLSRSYLLGVAVAAWLLTSVPLSAQPASNPAKAAPKAWTLPRTPDGQPDLQGNWNNSTLTQLQRPRQFANKQYLSEQETVSLEAQLAKQGNWDRQDAQGNARNELGYNYLFWDAGTKLARIDGRGLTSLIIDPPDGRMPPLTPDAQKREAARREERSKHGPFDSWLDLNLAERCITRGN